MCGAIFLSVIAVGTCHLFQIITFNSSDVVLQMSSHFCFASLNLHFIGPVWNCGHCEKNVVLPKKCGRIGRPAYVCMDRYFFSSGCELSRGRSFFVSRVHKLYILVLIFSL